VGFAWKAVLLLPYESFEIQMCNINLVVMKVDYMFNLENKGSFETIGESGLDYKIEIEEQYFHDR
jgi:hypothetical protein